MIYLTLAIEFFKIGLFAFGGGMATIPFLYDLSVKYGWFDEKALIDMIAVSESTPGPIGINMATFTGYTTAGFLGALVSTIALIIPSLIIVTIVSKFLSKFRDNKYVNSAFYGLRPAVAALIAVAGFSIIKVSVLILDNFSRGNVLGIFNLKGLILLIIIFLADKKYKLHPIVYISVSAVVGIILKF